MMQNQLEASSYDARQLMRSASETASKWCLSQASQPLASCHQVLGMGDDQHALAQGHGDPEPLISTWAPDNHSQTEGLHQESMNEEDRMDICSDDIEADNHTKPPYAESVGVEESKTVPPASGEPQDASLVAAFSQLPDSSQMPLAGLYSTTNQPPRPPGSLTGAFGGFRPRTYPPHMERWMRKCNLSAEISLSPPNEIRSQLPNFPSGPPPHLYQEVKGDQTSAVYLRPGPFYRSDRGREAMRACKNIKWPELESYEVQSSETVLTNPFAVPQSSSGNATATSSSATLESLNQLAETNFHTRKKLDTAQFVRASTTGSGRRATVPPGAPRRKRAYSNTEAKRFPPEGFIAQWNETGPRIWGNMRLPGPDVLPPEEVWSYIHQMFETDIKQRQFCEWFGCGNPQKNLAKHVKSVHLGLKLVCTDCGHAGRPDHITNSKRKVHEVDCPRVNGAAVGSWGKASLKAQPGKRGRGFQAKPGEGVFQFVSWTT